MQTLVSGKSVSITPSLEQWVQDRVGHNLCHYVDRLTRVHAYLMDDKSKRRGPDDHRITLEARPAGGQPIVVEHRGKDLYKVIDQATMKLARAVSNRMVRPVRQRMKR